MLTRKPACFCWILVLLIALWLSSGLALAQTPGPTVLWQFRTPGQAPSGRFQLVHNRTHFAPGAATPFHHHPGQVVVTVLEGENTFTLGGVERVYRAGESFVEQPYEVNHARNAGTVPMSVMATYLMAARYHGRRLGPHEYVDTAPPCPTVRLGSSTYINNRQ